MTTGVSWRLVEATVESVSNQGTVGVSIVGPDGARWEHHGDRKFSAASTVKIPIMVSIFRQIDQGKRSLDDRYQTKDEDKTGGSGVLSHMRANVDLSLYDLLYLMMSISDNMATNILIEMAGMDAVNQTMQDLGMNASNLSRPMKGRPAEADERENLATPNDYVRAIELILGGEAASRGACDAMAEILSKQQNRRRIARHLPTSNAITWGTKTGTSHGVANDVGYIIAPNGRLLIAVYTENFADTNVAEYVIGDIARSAMADTGVVGPLYTT